MVVQSKPARPMVVCYPADDVPMIEDPKRPGHFKPDVTWLITEDDTPVDSRFCEKQMRLFTAPLYTSWVGEDGKKKQFVATANVGLFFSPTEPPVVPDALLSVGVSYPGNIHLKEYSSYFVWEYGKVPEVTIEIVSNRVGGEDTRKLGIYARIGVIWYVVFDPEQFLSSESIRIFHLEDGEYRQVDDRYFPEVGLGLTYWEGCYEEWENGWLRWCYEDGTLVPTGDEEKQRADEEKRRADYEKQRADKLAAKLRALGIDPSINGQLPE